MQRHRHQKFVQFSHVVEAELPADNAVDATLNNYATPKQPKVRSWLNKHPHCAVHFVPTSHSRPLKPLAD